MYKLTTADRVRVIAALVEGCSIRSTVRMTGVSKDAVSRLLVSMGCACADFHNERVRGITTKRVQCDEIWAFIGAKQKQVDRGAKAHGDTWTWTAIDADTKLCVSYLLATRDAGAAWEFMHDLSGRLLNKIQLTTDGLTVYLDAVADNFGREVDYGQLIKLYGDDPRTKGGAARYSPAQCVGCKPYARLGDPDPKHISTSYVERQNLSMRMGMRRFTRLTNAFSKKVENHGHAIALYFAHYNFRRVHQTIRCTPAMEAGLTDHVWELEELVALLERRECEAVAAGAFKRGAYRTGEELP